MLQLMHVQMYVYTGIKIFFLRSYKIKRCEHAVSMTINEYIGMHQFFTRQYFPTLIHQNFPPSKFCAIW